MRTRATSGGMWKIPRLFCIAITEVEHANGLVAGH